MLNAESVRRARKRYSCVFRQFNAADVRLHATHLDEQEQVRVLALGGRPVALLDVVLDDIDTLNITTTSFSTSFSTTYSIASSPSCLLPGLADTDQ